MEIYIKQINILNIIYKKIQFIRGKSYKMELRQLKSFLKIVELQSFSKAAKALGYSQSALSIQIRELEEELGVKLFDRLGRQIIITQPGEELAQRAQAILHQTQEIENLWQNRPPAETLHLGMIDSLCEAWMPQVMEYFAKYYPEIHVTITINSPSVLLEALDHNRVDLVYILDKPLYNPKWNRVLSEKESIVFVGSRDNPLVWRNEVTLPELMSQRFFLTEKADNYRLSLDQYLAARQLSLKPFLEVGDTGFILNLVQRNLGLSFLPQYVVENSQYRDRLKVIHVKGFHMSLYRQLFYHSDKWLTMGMKAFLNLLPNMKSEK